MSKEMGKNIEPGRMNARWWERKKLFEWEYVTVVPLDPKMVERFGKPVVHVAIVRQSRSEESGDGDTTIFTATCDWFGNRPGDREISSKSLGELKIAALRKLDDCVLAQSGIVWSDWLEVKIANSVDREEEKIFGKRGRRDEARRANLSIDYRILKRAKLPDGRDMMLESGWSMKKFPKPKAAGVKAERRMSGDDCDWRDEDTEYAYIPATPENIAALDSVSAMIRAAGDRLQSILGQKKIEKTIAHVGAGLPLLEMK